MKLIKYYFLLHVLLYVVFLPNSAFARIWDAHAIIDHNAANMCALTFDDGPTHLTAQLLDALKEENIPATFVVLGKQAELRPKLIMRMIKEGHEVASHGYAHPNLREISYEEAYLDIKKTHDLLNELGADVKFFRPPFGKYTKDVRMLVEQLGMSILLWSVDSRDWVRRPDYGNMQNILERPMTAEEMRGIFLFHDTKVSTVNDARLIVAVLRAVGCKKFVTVSQYLKNASRDSKPRQIIAANKPVQTAMLKKTRHVKIYELRPVSIEALTMQKRKKVTDSVREKKLSFFQNPLK